MPNRSGSTRPKDALPRAGLRMTDGVLEQGDVASRQRRLRWVRTWPEEREPDEPSGFGYGDLLEGSLAVAALLGMVAIGVSPWLAIPLAAIIYIAIALLRPSREHRDKTIDEIAAEQPGIEVIAEDRGHKQFLDGALTDADAVAARFGLTRREREILPLLAQRLTDREIAEQLSISHRTAMNHTANILGKIGLASRRDVAALIARHDALLPPSAPPYEPE